MNPITEEPLDNGAATAVDHEQEPESGLPVVSQTLEDIPQLRGLFNYSDLEFDADVVPVPMGYEVTLRGLCMAASKARGLQSAEQWNALDMATRQDAVAEAFAWLCDRLEIASRPMLVEPQVAEVLAAEAEPMCVSTIEAARALPVLPAIYRPSELEHTPHRAGTVTRFKDPDGTTMVVVLYQGQLHKVPAAAVQPQTEA